MAVEAHHLNLFPSQFITTNRDFMNINQGNTNIYNNTQMMDQSVVGGVPLAKAMPQNDHQTILPISLYNSQHQNQHQHQHQHQSMAYDSVLARKTSTITVKKSDSGLTTYNLPITPRKRSRDTSCFNEFNNNNNTTVPQKNSNVSDFVSSSPFLGHEDINLQIQIQQLEMDRIISQHTEKLKMELEERRKRQSRMLVSAMEGGVMKKLKEKDEEMQRIGKVNWVLQERVKTLFLENQLWRDLAQSNEATANTLRNNLEQVLAHVSEERLSAGGGGAAAGEADDAESCCDSNDCGGGEEKEKEVVAESKRRCMLAGEGLKDEVVKDKVVVVGDGGGGANRMCKKCGERESCVLLLPCRHLCLCTSCGSTLYTCPVCNSNMTASLHVNMS